MRPVEVWWVCIRRLCRSGPGLMCGRSDRSDIAVSLRLPTCRADLKSTMQRGQAQFAPVRATCRHDPNLPGQNT